MAKLQLEVIRIYQRIQRYMEEVGIEMHDFANISAKTIVYAVLDDFSGNTLMGPTVLSQYRNVKTEKVILKNMRLLVLILLFFQM